MSRRSATLLIAAVAIATLAASCASDTSSTATGADDAAPPGSTPGVETVTSTGEGQYAGYPIEDEGWAIDLPGVQKLEFKYGPIAVNPGQNSIEFSGTDVPKPDFDGWVVGIKPDLERADGTVPPVDELHLHHGVWLNLNRSDPTSPRLPERIFAAGEEKTILRSPPGFGYRYEADDNILINYMLHNLWPTPETAYITYTFWIIPEDHPSAEGIREARPIWMDVVNGSLYPVFDVLKGSGTDGRFTFPDDDPAAYPGEPLNEWTVDRDSVIIGMGGHLHPGGLSVDLDVRRDGVEDPANPDVEGDTVEVFSSIAEYYEPAGAVSWDVSMTVAPPEYRVAVQEGDVLSLSTTYDSERASWYESMGIMVLFLVDGDDGVDPFAEQVEYRKVLSHGHLAENDNHGGQVVEYPDSSTKGAAPKTDRVSIVDYVYAPGDMAIDENVPVIAPGEELEFFNEDDKSEPTGLWHTVTACKAPCDRDTGVAYPLADADIVFDSGELGTGGPPTAGRNDWTIPTDLPEGTYTYFCRIHPFMRGAFRVEDGA